MKTITTYTGYIHRGRTIVINNKSYQRKVGAVVAVVDGTTLRIGWSLCNSKEGDRFNPEIAMSLAEGRARQQHSNSVKYSKRQAPSTSELMRKGIPQSCLSTMSQLITRAFADHPELRQVQIFNIKTERQESAPQPMW